MPHQPKGQRTGRPRGRPKGAVNKATLELRTAAQKYTEEALNILIGIARNGENEGARVSAVKEILDRGWGKSPQAIEAGPELTKMILAWAAPE